MGEGYVQQLLAPPWAVDALCKDLELPTEFFTDLAHPGQVDAAVEVCQACPVQWDCLAWAIEQEDGSAAYNPEETPDRAYVFGGYRPAERERLSLALAQCDPPDPVAWLQTVAPTVLAR